MPPKISQIRRFLHQKSWFLIVKPSRIFVSLCSFESYRFRQEQIFVIRNILIGSVTYIKNLWYRDPTVRFWRRDERDFWQLLRMLSVRRIDGHCPWMHENELLLRWVSDLLKTMIQIIGRVFMIFLLWVFGVFHEMQLWRMEKLPYCHSIWGKVESICMEKINKISWSADLVHMQELCLQYMIYEVFLVVWTL